MTKFNRKILENGLTILHEKRDVDVSSVMISVPFGAIHENEREKGVAHFIEHLCFKGTEKRTAKEIASELEGVGGNLNAFTGEEMTAYHVKLPSNHLELAVDVLSDIFFNASFPEEEVKRESNVILEEIKMYHDNPRAHVLESIKSNLYSGPFGMFIAGTEKTVKSMDRDFLLKKHRSIYVPKNTVISVVGNNDFDEVLKVIKKYIGFEREGISLEEINVEKKIVESFEKRNDLMQTNLALGVHLCKVSDDEVYAVEVFNEILGSGMSSRLFTEVRERRGLVYLVRSELDIGRNYGYMIIFAGTDKDKVKEVIDVCKQEFSMMENLSEEELERAKVQVIGKHKIESENSNDTALKLIIHEFAGDVKDYYSFPEKIKDVKLDEIKQIAQKRDFASFVLSN